MMRESFQGVNFGKSFNKGGYYINFILFIFSINLFLFCRPLINKVRAETSGRGTEEVQFETIEKENRTDNKRNESNDSNDINKNNDSLNPSIRIISGKNYEINLNSKSNIIYLIPLNYKVEREEGVRFPGEGNRLQLNEVPQTLNLIHVGMSILGLANNTNELYVSFFIQGNLPSECHNIKVETKSLESKDSLDLNTLIFSGINRTRLCVTQNSPIEATFISHRLVRDTPIILRVNYQKFAEVLWQNDELQVIYNNNLWKITKVTEILNQKPIDKKWKNEWVEGKSLKVTK